MSITFLTADEIATIRDYLTSESESFCLHTGRRSSNFVRVGCFALGTGSRGSRGLTDGRRVYPVSVDDAIRVCNGDAVLLRNGDTRPATASERRESIRTFFCDFKLEGDALLDFAVGLVEKGATDLRAIRAELRASGLPYNGATINALLTATAALA